MQERNMQKFLCRHVFLLLLGGYLRVELLGHMVNLCFLFKKLTNAVEVAAPYWIPTNSARGIQFLYILASIGCHLLFFFIASVLIRVQ